MSNFYEILRRSEKNIARDLFFSERHAQGLFHLIKEYYKDHPEATAEEVHQYFQDEFLRENKEFLRLPTIRTETIKYNTCRFLIDNPSQIREAYDKISREEQTGKKIKLSKDEPYTSNRLGAIRRLTCEVLDLIRTEKTEMPPQVREMAEKIFGRTFFPEKNTISTRWRSENRKGYDKLKELFEGTESDQIERYLRKFESGISENLRNNYIEILEFLGKSFTRYGILTKNCEEQQRLYKKLGFTGLENSLDDDSNGISVSSFFKKEALEQMETEKLAYLSMFWMNRYTKMVGDLNRVLFMVNQLDLWKKIKEATPDERDGLIHLDINEDELRKVYEKAAILDYINMECFELAKKLDQGSISIDAETTTKIFSVDVTQAVNLQNSIHGSLYCDYFYGDGSLSATEDEENPFVRDLADYRVLRNVLNNGYRMKDMYIIGLLSNLFHAKTSKNWGVIFEDDKDVKTSQKILFGVDIPGLNMPLRVHADRIDIIDYLKASQNNTYMPIYEGQKDFTIMGERVGTPILMPLSLKQKVTIENLSSQQINGSDKKRFLAHLEYLADSSKYPEHLKVEKTQKKKGKIKTIKVIPERKYVDLVSGEQFTLDKNNERIPIKQSPKGERMK